MKRKSSKIHFIKTARSTEMKKIKEWIVIILKAANERCFPKTATSKFWKRKKK